nr:FHA domain-containing protein [Bifidobacterium miconis]
MVRVKGCDQVSVSPSESLEIGRKPIRPLADDGNPRFEVPDETRSMSKRHAVFSVAVNGSATLRDMHSTNGTYMVREDGQLLRLPADAEFPLPSAAVRMQFGDVPVDFVMVDEPVEPEPEQPVADLFEYAVGDNKPEPDASGLSVDDILDLRAGEPTSMFDASSVSRRASELKAASLRSFTPMRPIREEPEGDGMPETVPLNVMPVPSREPRDLFADAMSDSADLPDVGAQPFAVEPVEPPAGSSVLKTDAGSPADRLMPISVIAQRPHHTPVEPQPTNLPAAQSSIDQHIAQTGEQPTVRESPVERTAAYSVDFVAQYALTGARTNPASDGSVDSEQAVDTTDDRDGQAVDSLTSVDDAYSADDAQVEDDGGAAEDAPAAVRAGVGDAARDEDDESGDTTDTAGADDAATHASADGHAAGPADGNAGETAAAVTTAAEETQDATASAGTGTAWGAAAAQPEPYTPAFEPGSVFDRVSKGEFRRSEPAVEVNGYTSDDAKRTTDFSTQFAMARYPQLLPFLAMNPSLYDDLYAWLVAQGNADVDAALADNPGYQDYRKAAGK